MKRGTTICSDLDPQKDIDLSSLHFGGSEEVNFGKGSTKVLRTERSGKDLIITFDAGGNRIPKNDYAAKLIGRTKDGKLFYGYARLPWVSFTDPILSAEPPTIERAPTGSSLQTVVQNFGQYASKNATLTISYLENDHEVTVTRSKIPPLQPFEKIPIDLHTDKVLEHGIDYNFVLTISQDGLSPVLLHWKFSSVQ